MPSTQPPPKLERNLILVSYILSLFGIHNKEYEWLDVLASRIKESRYEKRNEDGSSQYVYLLEKNLRPWATITPQDLLRYDTNIMRYTDEISRGRTSLIVWKYFQYLSLLFTEIYLDKYFKDKEQLQSDLNSILSKFNNPLDDTFPNTDQIEFEEYTLQDLTKLAYRSATGSWKTLMMHVHIKQYLYYAKKHKTSHNKVLLITPNEWLSHQHKQDFDESWIPCTIFQKWKSGAYKWWWVEIIRVTQLDEKNGDEKVAVDSLLDNNIVFIDEWHNAVWWDVRKSLRDQLSKRWFAFEYSATFGQAIHASKTKKDKISLIKEYGKAIIFDYSYKYFYNDGYGKEYRIYNITDNKKDQWIESDFQFTYLVASLLINYQQHLVYNKNTSKVLQYNLAKPLRVFVWATVSKSLTKKDWSDILTILKFFDKILHNPTHTLQTITDLLSIWLIDAQGKDIFAWAFIYIKQEQREHNISLKQIYEDILRTLFHAASHEAHLYVDNLKWVDGELWLRVGNNPYFWVINVWEPTKLFKLCQKNSIKGIDKDFSSSLFHKIKEKGSDINLLIWSRKFTEWRSSWRVSMMWLMNLWRSEWSQIIQLFGRGVRLKWYNMSLKRSTHLDIDQQPEASTPTYIPILETLQIFWIRADYMSAFKEYLKREWLKTNETEKKEIAIKTQQRFEESMNLSILRKKDTYLFTSHKFVLEHISNESRGRHVEVDMYPKVQLEESDNIKRNLQEKNKHIEQIGREHFVFLDRDRIYIAMKKYKDEKRMYNLSLDFSLFEKILLDTTRYTLYIPKKSIAPNKFDNITRIQEVVETLLKMYIAKYYSTNKWIQEWKHLEIVPMTQKYANEQFIDEYTLKIDEDQTDLLNFVDEMKKIASLDADIEYSNEIIAFLNIPQHLYTPLIWKYKKDETVTITPTHINDGERKFLLDLKDYLETNKESYYDANVYLMRNQSKKWMWFFSAYGWFYPDFVMWIHQWGKQHIIFIDPKWLRNMWIANEKIQLYYKLKKIEKKLWGDAFVLDSYIISNTEYSKIRDWWLSKQEFVKSHVLFQEDAWYIQKIFEMQ